MGNPLANTPMGLFDSLGISILGFSIVFFVLIALMFMIRVMRTVMEQLDAKKAPAAEPVVAAAAAATPSNMVPAKGSVGQIKLYDVDDRTAAMIMAIVADKMEAPLNELRFHSIREKK